MIMVFTHQICECILWSSCQNTHFTTGTIDFEEFYQWWLSPDHDFLKLSRKTNSLHFLKAKLKSKALMRTIASLNEKATRTATPPLMEAPGEGILWNCCFNFFVVLWISFKWSFVETIPPTAVPEGIDRINVTITVGKIHTAPCQFKLDFVQEPDSGTSCFENHYSMIETKYMKINQSLPEICSKLTNKIASRFLIPAAQKLRSSLNSLDEDSAIFSISLSVKDGVSGKILQILVLKIIADFDLGEVSGSLKTLLLMAKTEIKFTSYKSKNLNIATVFSWALSKNFQYTLIHFPSGSLCGRWSQGISGRFARRQFFLQEICRIFKVFQINSSPITRSFTGTISIAESTGSQVTAWFQVIREGWNVEILAGISPRIAGSGHTGQHKWRRWYIWRYKLGVSRTFIIATTNAIWLSANWLRSFFPEEVWRSKQQSPARLALHGLSLLRSLEADIHLDNMHEFLKTLAVENK